MPGNLGRSLPIDAGRGAPAVETKNDEGEPGFAFNEPEPGC